MDMLVQTNTHTHARTHTHTVPCAFVQQMTVAMERCEPWMRARADATDAASDNGADAAHNTDDGPVMPYCLGKACTCASPFVKVLLSRLGRVFSQSFHINLLLTAVLTRILQVRPLPAAVCLCLCLCLCLWLCLWLCLCLCLWVLRRLIFRCLVFRL